MIQVKLMKSASLARARNEIDIFWKMHGLAKSSRSQNIC